MCKPAASKYRAAKSQQKIRIVFFVDGFKTCLRIGLAPQFRRGFPAGLPFTFKYAKSVQTSDVWTLYQLNRRELRVVRLSFSPL
jgi:hypothetical protein